MTVGVAAKDALNIASTGITECSLKGVVYLHGSLLNHHMSWAEKCYEHAHACRHEYNQKCLKRVKRPSNLINHAAGMCTLHAIVRVALSSISGDCKHCCVMQTSFDLADSPFLPLRIHLCSLDSPADGPRI